MRIAHVTPAYYPARVYGGPPESTYQLTRHLARRGGEVRVLTTDANGLTRVLDVDKARELTLEAGLRVRYCPRWLFHAAAPSLLARLPELLRWCDVVHLTAVYNFTTIPTLAAARAQGKPVVWSPRGGLIRWQGATKPRAKAAWEGVCRAVAPKHLVLHVTSAEEAQKSEARMPGFKAVVVPNGVSVPAEAPHRAGEALRLLYLGRLHPIKGVENLIAACAKLEESLGRPFTLTVAGGGDAEYEMALRAQAAPLAERVRFLGEVGEAQKEELFASTDVLVAPSYSENFGLAIAEALAHGLPVIAGRGTPWRGLEEQGAGLWVDNDAETLARAIAQASAMPLAEMGARGRRWVEEAFGWDNVAKQMMDVYRDLLEKDR